MSGLAAKTSINISLNLCRKVNCNLTVVYIPNSNYWKPTDQYRTTNFVNILMNYTKSKSIDFINTSNFLDVEKGSIDYAIKGGHLSPIGYKKVAELLTNVE